MTSGTDSRRVGPFRLESEIGSGAMGVVWRAIGPNGAPVAVKLVRGPLERELLARFEREAKIRIDHPNVVRVIDAGVAPGGSAWMALELLEGESLDELIARRRLTAEEVVDIGVQACRGIAAAHARGVVHRDIKPSNLFRCKDGTVKVVDFGIALLALAADPRLTRTGGVVGTPAYMSPEQITGKSLDVRTDVWSLGAVLYEALSGRRAFASESPIALMVAILQEDLAPLRLLCPGAPPSLLVVINRALAKERDARWSSADELRAALERADLRPLSTGQDWDLPTVIGAFTPAHEALPPGEQRLVAVVLAEGVRDLPRVEAAIRAQGGRVLPLLGGNAIGLFGAEAWEGDEVSRAVSAALGVRAVAARVAVASGRATSHGRSISGGVLQAAEAGCTAGLQGVAVDVETARALRGGFEVREASGLLEVTSERARTLRASVRGDTAPLCGREAELAQLRAGLRAAVDEARAQVVLVTGPPGIGKSRLRRETERMLAVTAPSAKLLVGRAEPLRQDAAWGLLGDALRGRARTLETPLADEAIADAAQARDCASFLEELMGAPTTETPALAAARHDPQLMSDRLRLSVIDYFTGLAEQGPIALLLEDLQWADEATVLALEELLDRLAERPFFVLATARPELADHHPELFSSRDVRRVELRGLLSGEVSELAAAIADRPLSDSLIRWIAERSGGNPLFVEQLVLELVDRDLLDEEPRALPVPLTIEAAVQSRLDHLPLAEKDACKRAAIFRRGFSVEEVEALGVHQPASVLGSLARRDLLAARARARGAGREYHFRSSLVAEVAYGLLADELRAHLHMAAATYMDVQPSSDEEEVASHYQRGGDTTRAAERYGRAALTAARRGDNRRVLRCSELALSLGEALVESSFGLRMVRAEAMRFLGMREPQQREIDFALAAAQSDVERARALTEKVAWLSRIGRREEAISAGEEAVLAARAANDPEVLAVALGKQSATLAYAGRLEAARAALDEAAGLARETTPLTAAFLADVRAQLAAAEGDLAARRAAFADAAARYGELGDVRRAAGAEMNMGDTLSRFGAYRDAETALRTALEKCRRVGHRLSEGYALLNLGYAVLAQGREGEALAAIDEAAALASVVHEPRLEVSARVYRARALLVAGRIEGVADEARSVAAETERIGLPALHVMALCIGARALLASARPTDALELASRAHRLRDELGGVEEDEAEVFLTHAEALSASGREVEAAFVRERGRSRLHEIADRIADPAWRERFLRDVPSHRALAGG